MPKQPSECVARRAPASVHTAHPIQKRSPSDTSFFPRTTRALTSQIQAKEKESADKAASEDAARKAEIEKKREENIAAKKAGKGKVSVCASRVR